MDAFKITKDAAVFVIACAVALLTWLCPASLPTRVLHVVKQTRSGRNNDSAGCLCRVAALAPQHAPGDSQQLFDGTIPPGSAARCPSDLVTDRDTCQQVRWRRLPRNA